jgi:Cu(I)/Ag(I) efflux system membrane protein CusA/SilA
MIARIIRWSAQNRFLVLLATLFIVASGIYSVRHMALDAVPDLSDTQVIVYTDYSGQAPQVVEDQVTYPLTSVLRNVPRAVTVRGVSMFGASFIYVIFKDGTDIYWARSRVLEYLNSIGGKLPQGITPTLGPDATGVGWVYEYVVLAADKTLAELRSLQDWHLRYGLTRAGGVSEVASIGGFVKQYQVVVDPHRLQAYDIPLSAVTQAIRQSNIDVGGRVVEMTETEYVVRGKGYLRGISDLEQIALRTKDGTPVLLRDVAHIELGPDERRGVAEYNGDGEIVGGIVVQRFGENALDVINNVKAQIKQLAASLPNGVTVKAVYDRSDLIYRAIHNLRRTLIEESIIVALVCFLFLFHARSALVAIFVLPVGILLSFIVMYTLGVGSNIMSLGGIAIAIGAMVDAAIVMIENAHKHLERATPETSRFKTLVDAACEVGPSLFFSLLIITVSFLPIFTLEAQEGRMFKPLALTKTFAMASAAILSVTLVPVLMTLLIRGRIVAEAYNPINRCLIWLYRPVIASVLKYRKITILLALLVMVTAVYPVMKLGSEFMPSLYEGTLLYMPTTLPGISITKASELLQMQDRIIKSFPEVESVFGKAGRAETATDPAPLSMNETVVNLKPQDQWPAGMTPDKLIAAMNKALQIPGVASAWTQPIRGRNDMLSTGIRTPVGIKVYGTNLEQIEKVGQQIQNAIHDVPGTASVYAEQTTGGYYLDIDPDRMALARYGITIGDLQDVIKTALGGEAVTTTVEGNERYTVNVRYPRDYRSDPQAIAHDILVPVASGGMVPLGQMAHVSLARGPDEIRTENAQLVGYIYVDIRGRDIGGYVADAKGAVRDHVQLPPGVYLDWSGQFEYMQRAKAKLEVVVPFTLLIILTLLYLNFGCMTEALIVFLALPFSLVGGLWLMYWLGFDFSVAVAVGFIALAGLAAQTGVVMLIYLDQAYEKIRLRRFDAGQAVTLADLYAAVMQGAVDRVRPKMMTVTAIMAGLLPIMWSNGTGSDVMQRIAVPMLGGMVSSTILTLVVIPVIYALVKQRGLGTATPPPEAQG